MKNLIALLLLFTSINSKPFAQKKYSLPDCYQLALDKNISIQRAQNGINAAVIDNKSAQYNLLPSLSYGMQHKLSFGKDINPVTNNFINETFSGGSIGLGLQFKIFSGFSMLHSIRQSKYLIEAAAYAKKKTELEILQQVTLAYARLLLNKEHSGSIRNTIARTSKELEIIAEKVKLGKVTKYEFYILDARKNSEQADLAAVQNDSLTALQELKQLLNVSYKEAIDIEPIDTTYLSALISTDIASTDFIDMMLQRHPAIQQAKMEEQVARMNLKISKSSFFPSLSVGGNLASNYHANQGNVSGIKLPIPHQLTNNFGQSISINLQVPVFSQMKFANRIKKEKIAVSNAQYAIKEAENSVISNTLQLVNDFNSAKQKYMATSAAWQQNHLSYSIYEEKYKLGLISSLELITAKDLLNASHSKYLQAKFELFFRYQLLEIMKAGL